MEAGLDRGRLDGFGEVKNELGLRPGLEVK